MAEKAVFLINLGTPDNPAKKEVRRYLSEFLDDKYVIDIPGLFRKILVHGFIVPFRTKKSATLYSRLWMKEGSPLLIHLNNLATVLAPRLGSAYKVIPAMRYGNPSLAKAVRKAAEQGIKQMIFIPLYPQYALSTTGSTIELIQQELKGTEIDYRIVEDFYDHPAYLAAFSKKALKYDPESFDHILFSFHGLPLRQIRKIHPAVDPLQCECRKRMPSHGKKCYQAACYETTRLLAKEMNLEPGKFSVTFQSRLSRNWLSPFTDETLVRLAREGKKRILVFAPSFVADCLETLVEIKEEAAAIFRRAGGEELVLAESLNDDEAWAEAVRRMVMGETEGLSEGLRDCLRD